MKQTRVVIQVFSILCLYLSVGLLTVHSAEIVVNDDLFAPDRLIEVEVVMEPDDWHALRISHRDRGEDVGTFAQSTFEYHPAVVIIDGERIENVGVRKKGFLGSVVSTRPSLKIRFDKYVKKQSFAGLDMMTLNNNNQDPTQAQQILSYGLLNAAGAISPRCNLAHVTVNGEDLGIYTHIESIRKPFVKAHIGTTKGDLYEGYAGDFVEERFARIIHKWGKDDDLAELEKFSEIIRSPGPIPISVFEKHLALDDFITLWATEVLIGHWDSYSGNRNNWYAFRERETGRITFIPWGADSIFADPGPFIRYPVPKSVKARGIVCRRLWELPEIRERYRAEMQRLLHEVWDEEQILARLNQVQELTRDHQDTDMEDLHARLSAIREFIHGRRAEIQAELDGPAPDWPSPPNQREGQAATPPPMEIVGSFTAEILDEEPPRRMPQESMYGKGSADLEVWVENSSQTPFNQFGVVAAVTQRGIRKQYPVVQIFTGNDSDDLQWRISFILDPHQVKPGSNELPVDEYAAWAQVRQSWKNRRGAQVRWTGVKGMLKLDGFNMEPGESFTGEFRLHTTAFQPPGN